MASTESKSSILVSSAILLRQAGYDHKAIEVLQLAIKEDLQNTQAYVLLGALSQAIKNYDLAENYFREALVLEQNNGDALQGLGLFLISQHRYAEAIPYLEKHHLEYPNNLLSLDGLIESYSNLPDKKDELQDTLQQIWENTENPDIGFRYARHLLDVGNPEKAQGVILSFIETSSDPNSLAELAEVFFERKDLRSVEKLLTKAIKLNPEFERGWRDLAKTFTELMEKEKALEAIERAISINPVNEENHFLKVLFLHNLGDYQGFFKTSKMEIDRLSYFEENEKKHINILIYRLIRIKTYMTLEKTEEVLLESKIAREEYPDQPIFYEMPVDYLLFNNQPEESLRILRSAPTNKLKSLLRPKKYQVLSQMDRSEEAWKCIQPYLKKASEKDIENLVDIGARFYYRGMPAPALSVHQQLFNFKPEDLRIANNLGYILIGEGDYSSALEILTSVANQPVSVLFRDLARCNLAYIYNLKENFKGALSEIEKVMNSEFTQEDAKLRVSFWIDGSMVPDPSPIPGRDLSFGECALSCGVSSALANSDFELAGSYATKLKETSNSEILTEMVSGSLELAKGDIEQAKNHWTKALSSVKLESDQRALETWLKLTT